MTSPALLTGMSLANNLTFHPTSESTFSTDGRQPKLGLLQYSMKPMKRALPCIYIYSWSSCVNTEPMCTQNALGAPSLDCILSALTSPLQKHLLFEGCDSMAARRLILCVGCWRKGSMPGFCHFLTSSTKMSASGLGSGWQRQGQRGPLQQPYGG